MEQQQESDDDSGKNAFWKLMSVFLSVIISRFFQVTQHAKYGINGESGLEITRKKYFSGAPTVVVYFSTIVYCNQDGIIKSLRSENEKEDEYEFVCSHLQLSVTSNAGGKVGVGRFTTAKF